VVVLICSVVERLVAATIRLPARRKKFTTFWMSSSMLALECYTCSLVDIQRMNDFWLTRVERFRLA
jgi:hypothetical protein